MSVLARLSAKAWLLRCRSVRSLTGGRLYGSAAAAQLQYEYYEEDDESRLRDWCQARPLMDSDGWVPARGVQWVVIGDPGAKKHFYAERLAKLLDVPHISMGTLVRQELHPRSLVYQQIANSVSEGKLVPMEIIFALLSKRLEESSCKGETGFILDGIPRSKIQAEILDQMIDIDLVVNFKSLEDQRMMKNSGCNNLNVQSQNAEPESKPANVVQSWKENLTLYTEQGKSLEDYYRRHRKIVDFQVKVGAPGESWQGLLAALHLQHRDAVSSSRKLTA